MSEVFPGSLHSHAANQIRAVGIVVPARNEAASIAACVRGICLAIERLPRDVQAWVVVVADDCTDETAAVARRALGCHGVVIEACEQAAGAARRLGAEALLDHFEEVPPAALWIANTDADSVVPPGWLNRHLGLANGGNTAIAGVVTLQEANGDHPALGQVFRDSYPIDADGTHEHVHGANLGVRADAYLAVGGWSCAALAEDHCLWNRLNRAGWRVIATARSVVATSGRLQGRAEGGFATTLNVRLENALFPLPESV
jgi:cellulose synthase/poly-beta-1,6-N-acetylglucosamine synthase-like glycosyltransferase